VESSGPISHTPATSSVRKTPKNTGQDLVVPESADEGNTQVEYFSD
jgi:hypothetical protein